MNHNLFVGNQIICTYKFSELQGVIIYKSQKSDTW